MVFSSMSPGPGRFLKVKRQETPAAPVDPATSAASTPAAETPVTTTSPPAAETTSSPPAATTEPATTPPAASTTTPPAETTSATATTASTTSETSTSSALVPSSSSSSSATSAHVASSSSSASASSSPAASRTSGPASSAAPSVSVVFSTYTSMFTNADGSTGTLVGVSSSASTLPSSAVDSSGSSSGSGKTWGIVGGVVGGVVALVGIIYIAYRFSQRRFSNLDDDDDAIKWPALQMEGQEVSASTSTLNPLGTRRTGGAGVGDGEEDEMSQRGEGWASMSGGTSAHNRQLSYEQSYEQLAMADYTGQHGDPYLGASAAPFPPPAAVYPPTSHYAPTYYSDGYQDHAQSQEALSSVYSQHPPAFAGAQGAVNTGRSPPIDEFQEQSRRGSIGSYHSAASYSDPFANYSTASRAASPRVASPSPFDGRDPLRRGGSPSQGPL